MRRGELWTVAGAGDYAGKPRPVLIIQDDRFDATDSITVCPLTTAHVSAPLIRIPVAADVQTGLREESALMVDKVTTVSRSKLGQQIGRAPEGVMLQLGQSLVVFLGLAG
jgi:mRNA interferase MazF